MTRSFRALLLRDLKLAARVGGSGVMGLIFFLMIVTLIPFALGPDLNLLSRIGPAILWIAALLATPKAALRELKPLLRSAVGAERETQLRLEREAQGRLLHSIATHLYRV